MKQHMNFFNPAIDCQSDSVSHSLDGLLVYVANKKSKDLFGKVGDLNSVSHVVVSTAENASPFV
jgi:hypothetical protein